MARPEDVIKIASKEIGYSALNDPEQGTKYIRWIEKIKPKSYTFSNNISWDIIFINWVMHQAKVNWDIIPCDNIDIVLSKIRKKSNGCFVSFEEASPGDIAVFKTNEKENAKQVGIIEENFGDSIKTIEGNANNKKWGNNVQRCIHNGNLILKIIRPPYNNIVTVPSEPVGRLVIDGIGGPLTVRKLQEQCGTMPDGIISGQPIDCAKYLDKIWRVKYLHSWDTEQKGSEVVKAVQWKIGAKPTGVWDQETSKKIQQILIKYDKHLETDTLNYNMGQNSVKALQKTLNENLWTKDFL